MVTKRIGTTELRMNVSFVVDAVKHGAVYVITRSGKDVAILGPTSSGHREALAAAAECQEELTGMRAERDRALSALAMLQARVSDLEEALADARELNRALRDRR